MRSVRSLGLFIALAVGACDDNYLGTNDVLVASFAPSYLKVASTTAVDCSVGAYIDLKGRHVDGTDADDTIVELWLTGTTDASLSQSQVTLKDGTDRTACLLPGSIPGTVTLHARSGVIETTAAIDVKGLVLPSDATLALTVSALPPLSSVTGSCAASISMCDTQRQTSATVIASSASSQILDGTPLYISTTAGTVTSGTTCPAASAAVANTLPLTLAGSSATALLCFGALGASATVTAHSGGASTSATLAVPPLVRGVQLSSSRTTAKTDDAISFVATVVDCNLYPIAGANIQFEVESGAVDLSSANPQVANASGVVTFTGTVKSAPLTVRAYTEGNPLTDCGLTVGATP